MHFNSSVVVIYAHHSFLQLLLFFFLSLLSGALVACLKKISVESWPDLSVQSKFFYFIFFLKTYVIHYSETFV